jgi:hypothetical protein
MTHKHCPKCECTLPIEQFYCSKSSHDGFESYCKDCKKQAVRDAYEKRNGRKQATNSKTHKWCPHCQTCKPHAAFQRTNGKRKRLSGYCKKCQQTINRIKHASRTPEARRNDSYKRLYGITLQEYECMLKEQDGRCKLCGTTEPGGRGNHFAVDHDHVTNEIRGLLCQKCNQGLGLFCEDPMLLAKAIKYLKGAHDECKTLVGV